MKKLLFVLISIAVALYLWSAALNLLAPNGVHSDTTFTINMITPALLSILVSILTIVLLKQTKKAENIANTITLYLWGTTILSGLATCLMTMANIVAFPTGPLFPALLIYSLFCVITFSVYWRKSAKSNKKIWKRLTLLLIVNAVVLLATVAIISLLMIFARFIV